MSNRYGLDINFYDYAEYINAENPSSIHAAATINFANETSLEISSDITWATGGQNHSNKIGFGNPKEGSFKISTQLVNMEMIALASGSNIENAAPGKVVIMNNENSAAPKAYVIKATTVWQGEDGVTYTEDLTIHKAFVKPGYKATYNGSGDPQSLDIEFELAADADNKLVTIERAEKVSA